MKIKNAVRWQGYSLPQAWAGTCAVVLLAFGIRYQLHAIVAPYMVFHFFTIACLMVQYLFGIRFSLVAMAASALLGEYFFVEPYGTFDSLARKDFLITLNFMLVTGVAVAFMERLRRATYAQSLLLKVMESRHRVSLHRENDRLFYAKRSHQTWAILEELIADYDRTLFYRYGGDGYRIGPLFYRLATRFRLGDDPAGWEVGVHAGDVEAVKRHMVSHGMNEGFELRLLQADGGERRVPVVMDHFKFMGKQLALLKLAEEEALPGPQSVALV